FGGRMAHVLGEAMEGVSWESMIGDNSNVWDVISQKTLFNEDKVNKKFEVTYLTFQDSMYCDEPGARERLVKAFYGKKLAGMEDGEDKEKLKKAYGAMDSKKPETIHEAFKLMGMKGVRPEVENVRNDIKTGPFWGKGNKAIDRGRSLTGRSGADVVLGFAA